MGILGEQRHRRGAAGGIVSGQGVTAAATVALYGLPAWRFVTTRDPLERLLLWAIAKRAAELDDVRQRNLAAHIVNTLAKAWRR
jgi:hypothetical protein